jgi:DNA-directed RNA polymerase specialized sigma24 family protein
MVFLGGTVSLNAGENMATKAQLESRGASTHSSGAELETCAAICARQQQRLFRLCNWMVHDEAEARALAVSVFLQYLRSRTAAPRTGERLEGNEEAQGDVLIRCLIQRFRTAFLHAEEPLPRLLPGTTAPVDSALMKAALLSLRPASRLLYLLYDLEGYSLETIADWVEMDTTHCARRIHSARIDLRNMLLAAA